MKQTTKHLAIGLMTLGFVSFAGQSTYQTPDEQTQQEQEQRQTPQQQTQEQQDQRQQTQQQQDQRQQEQQNCGVLASSQLEILVPEPCARVYLQGQLMKTVNSQTRSFIIPGTKTCNKYHYNVIVTYGERAQSFDLVIEANQIQRVEVR